MKIVIKNGRLIDPASGTDDLFDILIDNDLIAKIDKNIPVPDDAGTINAEGFLVLPGLIDMHVHFREPGREDVETIIGGSKVAAKGGYTSVCPMPNTDPVIDNQALVSFIKFKAEQGPINVFPIGTVSKGSKGEEISEMGELISAGAVAFSDDGLPVSNSLVMRRILEYSRMYNIPILTHSEDLSLTDNGIMNEGETSTILGMKAIPAAAEEVMIARDIILTELAKGKLHVCHLSSDGAVKLIRRGKKDNIEVTCETAPHYFALTDEAIGTHQAMAKMKPPLRTEKDRLSIIEGLRDGTIDVIATDHAPHSRNEKMQELEYAPFGIVGLETAVPLIISILVKENNFSYLDAFSKVTINPAKILGLNKGTIKEGVEADITIIDPDKKVIIDENFMISKCKNSPFIGQELFGSIEYTICNGNIVYSSK
jgi:dihydroorotase